MRLIIGGLETDGSRVSSGTVSRLAAGILVATLTTLIAGAADPPDPSAEVTVLRRCFVEYEDDTAIGSQITGVLGDCLVKPGDRVKAGQVLGRLRDDDVRAEVRVREAAAQNDVEIRLAKARNALAVSKADRTSTLMRKGAVSREEFTQHRLESEVTAIEIEQAKFRFEQAGLQLEQSRATLRIRELISPHDGIVVAVLRRKAEPVGPREEVFRVVNPDRLRIVGLVDVREASRIKAGLNAKIIPEIGGADLPIEREVFEGKVSFVDNRVDPLTRTCKIHVLAPNRQGLLRAGLEARLEIDTEAGVIQAAPETVTAPIKK